MYKLMVITDADSGAGFRLAGAEVLEAENCASAEEVLNQLLKDEEVGIIAIREDYLPGLEGIFASIEHAYHPVIIAIPAPGKGTSMNRYIEGLLRRAIGYNIVMRS